MGLEDARRYSIPGWMNDGAALGAEHLERVLNDDLPPAKPHELALVTIRCTKLTLSAVSATVVHVRSWCWWDSHGPSVAETGIKRKSQPRAKKPQRQLVFNKDSALFIPKDDAHQIK